MSIQRYDMEDGCLIDARDGFLCQYADLQSREAKLLAAIEAAKMDAHLLNQLIQDYEGHVKNFGISSVFRDARISIAQRLDGLIAYREKISQ